MEVGLSGDASGDACAASRAGAAAIWQTTAPPGARDGKAF